MICSKTHCCSCLSSNKKHLHDSPTHIHQRQYSPTSNTASSSLIKPTDLWSGADCLSPPTATIRNSNAGERHYETSSTAGSGTLQRCNHHHHHHPYHHTQETQPLTNNMDLNNVEQRHSYVPSNDGSSSIDGNTSGFTINGKFNSSIRTRPIAVGGPFDQQAQKKSMKNLREFFVFILLIILTKIVFSFFSDGYCFYYESFKYTSTTTTCDRATYSTESTICCST
jgi:hypothetical protein